MSESPIDTWQSRLQQTTAAYVYPQTPDIAGAVSRRLTGSAATLSQFRRLVWAAAVVVMLVFAVLASVPAVRAAVLEFLQVGVIRIFLVEPTLTPTATPTAAAAQTAVQTPSLPAPTPTDLVSVLDLAGETSLQDAARLAGFELQTPSYPEDLGLPHKVFLQVMDGAVVVFVWLDGQQPDQVRLSLFQIGPGSWAGEKGLPLDVEITSVNGSSAIWAKGPYPLVLRNRNVEFRRMIDGNVLVWTQGSITYRLEGRFTLAEAVKIAESLAPLAGQ